MKPLYENDTIYLTPFNESFVKESSPYLDWFHDVDVTRLNSHGLFPYGKKAMQTFLDSLDDGTKAVFAIITKQYSDRETLSEFDPNGYKQMPIHIGNCSLQRIDWVARSAEFAIIIGNTKYWKKGIGTMCLEFMLEHGFDKLGMNRIWTGTTELNFGMRKMARKCGMKPEGVFREASFLYGKYHNVHEYGVLLPEWEERTKTKYHGEGIWKTGEGKKGPYPYTGEKK